MDKRIKFNIQPIDPIQFIRPKTNDDFLIDGIIAGLKTANIYGEDLSSLLVKTLKQLGRYDLLPPCEQE